MASEEKYNKIKLQMNEHEIFLPQAFTSHICNLLCNIVLVKYK